MKKTLVFVGILLLTAVVAFWFFGRLPYRRYKEAGAIARAEKFLAAGDYPNANLSARQALAANARNLKASELMAQLAEIARAPQVLDWRRLVVELAPTL